MFHSNQNDGIVYNVLCPTHTRESIYVLADAFLNRNEPVCSHFHPYSYTKRLSYFINKTANNGLSSVAIDTMNNNKVIAVCFNEDYHDKTSPQFLKSFEKLIESNNETNDYKLMYQMVDDLRNKTKIINYSNTNKLYYISLIAIARDYENRGISTKLLKWSIENIAIPRGYKYAFSECTNEYSKQLFVNNGFDVITKLKYGNWEYPKKSNRFPKRDIANKTGFHYMYLVHKSLINSKTSKL
eukprot:213592_1